MRNSSIKRVTTETDIRLNLNLDGSGKSRCNSGIGFFDHMICLLAKHGSFDVEMTCLGDLNVDSHHSLEDMGIVMGEAIKEALGDKKGIARYATFYCPMDESLSRVCIDLSGRGYLVYQVDLPCERVGNLETESLREFFRALAINGEFNLHITNLYGRNSHHIIESIFKALGRALSQSARIIEIDGDIPSTKGIL